MMEFDFFTILVFIKAKLYGRIYKTTTILVSNDDETFVNDDK